MDHSWCVLVHVKLDNDWNEWAFIGAFSFAKSGTETPGRVATRAARIVDHKGEQIVRVEIYNPQTKLYADAITVKPIKF